MKLEFLHMSWKTELVNEILSYCIVFQMKRAEKSIGYSFSNTTSIYFPLREYRPLSTFIIFISFCNYFWTTLNIFHISFCIKISKEKTLPGLKKRKVKTENVFVIVNPTHTALQILSYQTLDEHQRKVWLNLPVITSFHYANPEWSWSESVHLSFHWLTGIGWNSLFNFNRNSHPWI